jgi:hypothetical protein
LSPNHLRVKKASALQVQITDSSHPGPVFSENSARFTFIPFTGLAVNTGRARIGKKFDRSSCRWNLRAEKRGLKKAESEIGGVVPGGRVELPTPAFSGPRSTGELPRHR